MELKSGQAALLKVSTHSSHLQGNHHSSLEIQVLWQEVDLKDMPFFLREYSPENLPSGRVTQRPAGLHNLVLKKKKHWKLQLKPKEGIDGNNILYLNFYKNKDKKAFMRHELLLWRLLPVVCGETLANVGGLTRQAEKNMITFHHITEISKISSHLSTIF